MTMSWVADANPSNTANRAMRVSASAPAAGSVLAMPKMANTTPHWANNIHERRRPNHAPNQGKGKRSTSGAHTNLNE